MDKTSRNCILTGCLTWLPYYVGLCGPFPFIGVTGNVLVVKQNGNGIIDGNHVLPATNGLGRRWDISGGMTASELLRPCAVRGSREPHIFHRERVRGAAWLQLQVEVEYS